MRTSIPICSSIGSAFKNWIVHGFDPGACTANLIRGEYDEAKTRIHELISSEDATWNDHIAFMETYLPMHLRTNYNSWTGLKNMKDEDQMTTMLLIMTAKDSAFIESLIKQAKG